MWSIIITHRQGTSIPTIRLWSDFPFFVITDTFSSLFQNRFFDNDLLWNYEGVTLFLSLFSMTHKIPLQDHEWFIHGLLQSMMSHASSFCQGFCCRDVLSSSLRDALERLTMCRSCHSLIPAFQVWNFGWTFSWRISQRQTWSSCRIQSILCIPSLGCFLSHAKSFTSESCSRGSHSKQDRPSWTGFADKDYEGRLIEKSNLGLSWVIPRIYSMLLSE